MYGHNVSFTPAARAEAEAQPTAVMQELSQCLRRQPVIFYQFYWLVIGFYLCFNDFAKWAVSLYWKDKLVTVVWRGWVSLIY